MTSESKRQQEKERYQWYKAHGICVTCGRNEAFNGRVRCPECLEMMTLYRIKRDSDPVAKAKDRANARECVKRLYHQRVSQGLCPQCGKPATHGVRCARHARINRQTSERYNRDVRGNMERGDRFRIKIAAGVCMHCGKPVVPGYCFCGECLPKRQELGRTNGGWHGIESQNWIRGRRKIERARP